MTDTHSYPIKHLTCGLHFIVYSWSGNWNETTTIHCPECGRSDGAFLVWHEEEPHHEIFHFVPGTADMVALTTQEGS